jgi:uncharacterized coiled-coil protein SlyX
MKAAKRVDMTLGAWLSRVIRDAVTVEIKAAPPGPTNEQMMARLIETMERNTQAQAETMQALAARLEAVETVAQAKPERMPPPGWMRRLFGLR